LHALLYLLPLLLLLLLLLLLQLWLLLTLRDRHDVCVHFHYDGHSAKNVARSEGEKREKSTGSALEKQLWLTMSKATETDASPSPAPSPAAAAAAQAQAPSTLVVEEVDDIVFESSEDAQPAATGEGAQDNARAAKQAKTGSGNNDQFTVHKWHVPRPSSMAAVLAPQQSLQQQQPAAVPVQRGGRGRGARRGGSRVPRNVGRPRKQAPSTASDYATVAGFSSRHVGVPPGGSTSMAIRAAAAAASNRPVDVGGGPIASNRPFRQAAAKRVFYGDKSDEEEDEQDAAAAAAAEEEEEQGNAEGDANGQDEDENDGEEDDDDEMDVDGQGRKVASVEVPGIVGNGTGNSREAAIKRQKISYQNQEQPLAVREKYRSQSAQSTFAPVPPTPNMQYMNTNVFSLNNKSPHFPLMPVDVTPFQHRQIDPSFALLPTTTSSPTSLLGPPPSSAALAAAAAAADKITAQTLGQVVECGAYLSQTQEEHLPLLRVLNRIMYPVSSLEPVCRFCDADIVTSSVECSCDPKDVLAHVLNWKGCTEMPWKHHLQVLMPLLSLVDKVPPADMVGCCRMLIAATRSNAAQTARSATSLSADVVKTIQLAGHHVTSACYLLDVSEATPDALKAVRYVLVRFLCDLDHRVFRMLQSSDPIRAIVGQKPSPAGHSKLAKRPTEGNFFFPPPLFLVITNVVFFSRSQCVQFGSPDASTPAATRCCQCPFASS